MRRARGRAFEVWLAIAAFLAISLALWTLHAETAGLAIRSETVEGTPVHVYRDPALPTGPAVVIAHGFAGSSRLMEPFAINLARNGYVAVTFDFLGHGENPAPMTGDVTKAEGATRALVAQTGLVTDYARKQGDGRLAILGHSMATDVIVRYASASPDVSATIAVSLFSPAVTADAPRNLLVIVGGLEGGLKREALRVLGLVTAPDAPREGVTHGDPGAGTGRRVAFSNGVEHVGVLYSTESMVEAVSWLDAVFGIARVEPAGIVGRGPWILLLIAGIVALGHPLSTLLPKVSHPAAGAALPWRRLWPALIVPAMLTPIVLKALPTHFLPVLVADYLAVHFFVYGALTAACVLMLRRPAPAGRRTSVANLVGAGVTATLYSVVMLGWALDATVTSLAPIPARLPIALAMLAGTLAFFLAVEWLVRGEHRTRGAYAAATLAFAASLALAVALDFQRLFFLIIIVPVVIPMFIVFGFLSSWCARRTGHPFVGAVASAIAFGLAIAATFPMIAG
jgi:dienelactone hydrolase